MSQYAERLHAIHKHLRSLSQDRPPPAQFPIQVIPTLTHTHTTHRTRSTHPVARASTHLPIHSENVGQPHVDVETLERLSRVLVAIASADPIQPRSPLSHLSHSQRHQSPTPSSGSNDADVSVDVSGAASPWLGHHDLCRVVVVSTYPPRQCGIAVFSHHLVTHLRAVCDVDAHPERLVDVIAVKHPVSTGS